MVPKDAAYTILVGISDDPLSPPTYLGVFAPTHSNAAIGEVVAQLSDWGIDTELYDVPLNPDTHAALAEWTDDPEGWVEEFVYDEETEEA